jgi:hypothetical protein
LDLVDATLGEALPSDVRASPDRGVAAAGRLADSLPKD